MLTAAFWKGALERAVKTFVQTTVASLIAFVGAATTAWEVDWLTGAYSAVGIGLLAAFLSLATSLGNADFTAGAAITPPSTQVNIHAAPAHTPEDIRAQVDAALRRDGPTR